MIVRCAKLDDIPAISDLGCRGIKEGSWDCSYDPLTVFRFLTTVVPNNLVYVAEEGEEIVGAIVMRMENWVWSQQDVFIEGLMLYVMPDYRSRTINGKSVASALISKGLALSASTGYRFILPVMWGDQKSIEIRDEYVRRSGLDYIGGTFSFKPDLSKIAAE